MKAKVKIPVTVKCRIGIDDMEVTNTSKLQELVARHRPGDEVKVKLIRDGEEFEMAATLKNSGGTVAVVTRVVETEFEGSIFEDVNADVANELGITGGVKLKELNEGKWATEGVDEGFIIIEVDKIKIESVEQLKRVMTQMEGERVLLLGVMENGDKTYYSIEW